MRNAHLALVKKYLKKKVYCTAIIFLLFVIYYGINTSNMYRINTLSSLAVNTTEEITNHRDLKIKYILLWNDHKQSPFNYFGEGQTVFQEKNCTWTNCYVTGDRNYLGDYTEFEVVAFNGPRLAGLRAARALPARRAPHQRYVFANIESAATYPICTDFWDYYFNWTWTYRLDSDLVWSYYVIRNSNNTVIGPSRSLHWKNIDEMEPIDETLKNKLRSKNKAAAWFVSNCDTQSLREEFAKEVQSHMRRFNLILDIYGKCGTQMCSKTTMEECLKTLEKDYFFYFAFENSLSEDYVTEKVLHGLRHNTVPVVFGGADYSRFLPPGSYLNARELGPRGIAETMNKIIRAPNLYYNFFKWKKYYWFHGTHEDPETDIFCQACAAANAPPAYSPPDGVTRMPLSRWWTPPAACQHTIVVKLR